MSDEVVEQLSALEEGDEITVSERDTPMEVLEVSEGELTGVTVTAQNHHGRYNLREHADGSISLRAGARLVAGDVEVANTQ